MRYTHHTGLLIFLILASSSCRLSSYKEYIDGVEVLHLEGSPYERGAAYGHLMKKEIRETISRWTVEVESVFERELSSVVEEFYISCAYRESIEIYDPELLEEVYGMAESTRIGFSVLLAFQMSEELFTLMEDRYAMKCTGIGRSRTGSAASILAQNMDPPDFLHGHPIVLHQVPSNGDPESFVFTVPGLLAMAGMNEKGLAITCMSMSMLNHAADGLPVVSVVRRILAAKSLDEVLGFMQQVSFAIPQCYGIGGPERVYCFECSAGQMVEFYPFEPGEVLLHTNYSINNRDFNSAYIVLLKQYGKTVDDPYYCPRYFLAYDKIKEYQMQLGRGEIASILRLEEPEVEPILNQNTLGTLIMELDDDPALSISLGYEEGSVFRNLTFR